MGIGFESGILLDLVLFTDRKFPDPIPINPKYDAHKIWPKEVKLPQWQWFI